MADLRGILEQLIGLATEMIHSGELERDPLIEERATRDRDSLRYELFENPDGFDSPMIAMISQRLLRTLVPSMDLGRHAQLLDQLIGQTAEDPESDEAADQALEKAQAIADAIEETNESIEDGVPASRSLVSGLRWAGPVGSYVGLSMTVTGTLLALGASGPVGTAIGAIVGLLGLYRPRD